MKTERWRRIESVCEAALACDPAAREALLARECAGDPDLRAEVEALLREQDRAERLLDVPAWEAAAAPFTDDAEEVQPGLAARRHLGPFIIEGRAGAGGMGEVYRAIDTRLGRTVAIKVLPPETAADPESRERLRLEAKAVSALAHPHICALFDIGSDDGLEYLVMEYLEGRTLAERLEAGGPEGGEPDRAEARPALPLDEALKWGAQMADALAAAHRRGIVHCDLKPGNVMLTKDGLKLLDFGVAQMRRGPAGARDGAGSGPDVGGAVLGTINYMSPEQFAGREPDARSDLFAFGAILFEMLTGRRAFDAASPAATIGAILEGQLPAVSRFQPLAPPALDRLVGACLAKDPDERWDSARLAAQELRRVAAGLARSDGHAPESRSAPDEAAAARNPRSSGRSWLGWAGAGLACAALAFAVAGWWSPPRLPGALRRYDLALPLNHSLHPRLSPVLLSPDGERLLYGRSEPDGRRVLYSRRLDQPTATRLEGTAGASYPFFSPDGRWVAFFAGSSLYKVDLAGGTPVSLCDVAQVAVRGGSWGDDGTIVAALAPTDGLVRIPSSGGPPIALTRLDPARRDVTHRWPQMLPGSRAVLFTAHTAAGRYDDASIEVQSLETGERKTLRRGGYYGRYLASGHLVFVRYNTLFAAPMNLARLELTGPAVPIVEDVVADADIGRLEFTVADTGTALCLTGTWQPPHYSPAWRDEAGRATLLPVAPGGYADPRISPGGGRIALSVGEGTLTRRQAAVLEPGSREPSKLLTDGQDLSPVWAPDGDHLVFGSDAGRGVHNLYWRRADGSGPVVRLTTSGHMQVASSFTPDGRRLAYLDLDPRTNWDVWALPLDLRDPDRPVPGPAEPLIRTTLNELDAGYSPDGRWLAYVEEEAGAAEVYVRSATGRGPRFQVSQGGGVRVRWSPRGGELLYQTPGWELTRVAYTAAGDTFVAGPPRPWRGIRLAPGDGAYTFRNWDPSPDGRRVLVLEPAPPPAPPAATATLFLNFFDELRRRAPSSEEAIRD